MKPRGEKGKERPIKNIWRIHRRASIKLSPMRGRVQYATRHLSVWFSQLHSTDSATSGHPSTLFSSSRVWCAKTIDSFVIWWKKSVRFRKEERRGIDRDERDGSAIGQGDGGSRVGGKYTEKNCHHKNAR